MTKIDLTGFIAKVRRSVDEHNTGEPGCYRRWRWQNAAGNRDLSSSEYGCADAANILYSLSDFPRDLAERAAFVAELQRFQNPETGLFAEPTHHTLHTTAHCTGALELFDARPLYPLTALEQYRTREGLYALLEGLNWERSPWNNAHQGAGIYAAFANTDSVTPDWAEAYFSWLDEHCDPEIGMSVKGRIVPECPLCWHLFGWFHYLFNYTYARRAYPCAEALVDTCLKMYRQEIWDAPGVFGRQIGFREIDWVYTVSRLPAQTGYRFAESREALLDFAEKFADFCDHVDVEKNEAFNDLHMLFGTVCAWAELQMALPGVIVTQRPLKLVLDRRPFI